MIMPTLRTNLLESSAALTRLSLAILGGLLIALIWLGVWFQIKNDKQIMLEEVLNESEKLALAYAQSVERTSANMDRLLKRLQTSYQQLGPSAHWPSILDTNSSAPIAQVAVISRDGMLIGSSKTPDPPIPPDLTDHDYFRAHAERRTDDLVFGKPLLRREPNQWCIEFTRPFFGNDGTFEGIIVASVDDSDLTTSLDPSSLGLSGGLGLIGVDGILRSGRGYYSSQINQKNFGTPQKSDRDHKITKSVISFDPRLGPIVTVRKKINHFNLEAILRKSEFAQHAVWLENRKLYLAAGGILSVLVCLSMAASLRQLSQATSWMESVAETDTLTGLHNRRSLIAMLDSISFETRPNEKTGLLIIDLDRFKELNDSFGNRIADKILARVAQRLRRISKGRNYVARLGGDQFAMVTFVRPGGQSTETLASWICSEIAEPLDVDGHTHQVGCSVGIVEDIRTFSNATEGLRCAGLALNSAKSGAGNGWRHYTPVLDALVSSRREIACDLKTAIRTGQFQLYYQPIVSASTAEVETVEALSRWLHPQKGFIPPDDFIPVAEQTGLIVEFGRWVLAQACADLAAWENGPAVAVNVSAIELQDRNYFRHLEEVLNRTGLCPNRLKLEITESVVVSENAETVSQLNLLRKFGVSIALDDFGTGYSSFGYLQSYPIDCIKLDRSFVRSMSDSSASRAIIRAIASMANELSITAVAEGVEDHCSAASLRDIGYSQLQGFLYGKPMPIRTLRKLGAGETPDLQLAKAFA